MNLYGTFKNGTVVPAKAQHLYKNATVSCAKSD